MKQVLWAFLLMMPWMFAFAAEGGADSDGDGLPDAVEAKDYRTDSQLADTDTDGLTDGREVLVHFTLPLSADSDGDGFLDGIEVRLGSDPLDTDSRPKAEENDLDGDGIRNEDERTYGTDPQRLDSDFDGLSDASEIRTHFTDPALADSDGDGSWDGEEINAGTDPTAADSHPASHRRE